MKAFFRFQCSVFRFSRRSGTFPTPDTRNPKPDTNETGKKCKLTNEGCRFCPQKHGTLFAVWAVNASSGLIKTYPSSDTPSDCVGQANSARSSALHSTPSEAPLCYPSRQSTDNNPSVFDQASGVDRIPAHDSCCATISPQTWKTVLCGFWLFSS